MGRPNKVLSSVFNVVAIDFDRDLSYLIDEEHSKNNDNKKYSLDNFLNIFLENIKNESILFKNYSKLIKNKFLNILDQNIKIQYEMNSHLNELYNTYESKFKNVLQNIKNYKEIYEKAGKLLEDSKKKYEIMKEENETKKEKNENNEADNLRYKKCEEENKQRIKEAKEKQEKYEDYIIIANKEREKYIRELRGEKNEEDLREENDHYWFLISIYEHVLRRYGLMDEAKHMITEAKRQSAEFLEACQLANEGLEMPFD